MWKKMLVRALCSAGVTCLASQLSLIINSLCTGVDIPLVPSYLAHFTSVATALGVYHLLVSLIGAVFGGFSVVFEIETWSFLKQGVIHLAATTAVWLPVSIFLWGLDQYPVAIAGTAASFTVTYGITWWMNYLKCRGEIQRINEKLTAMKEERSRNGNITG